MPLITVFTPAYNRARFLDDLHAGLEAQTFKDFEWIVVDDGSSDETPEVMDAIMRESALEITFFRQENGGKHRAINKGVELAKGELFFILDSDDCLPMKSLEIVAETYEGIQHKTEVCGVCGLMQHRDGTLISIIPPVHPYVDCSSIEMRHKYHVSGDIKEVFKTTVLKQFPFPEITGERFCPEMLCWNRIAKNYRLRLIDRVIYTADYLDDGLSAKIVKIRQTSPIATMMTYAEHVTYEGVPFKERLRSAINYYRFKACVKRAHRNAYKKDTGQALPKIGVQWWWTKPIGWLFHLKD